MPSPVPIGRREIVLLGAGLLVAPTFLAAADGDRYEEPDAIYGALRDQPHTVLTFDGGTITLVFADDAPGLDRAPTIAWIRRGAAAMMRYFGKFPIADYGLLVIAEPGGKVGHATTYGYGGPVTRIHVGTGADAAAFARDWVLVHEMLHAALPNQPRRALWLQEGNATYVEPIARAQAGQIEDSEVWRQLILGTPKGEPVPGDGGMDGTRAWAKLYWGGATFWLLAEIAIFEQSRGRSRLRDALRAASRASGGNAADWSPEQWMRSGDAATRTTALSMLYARFAAGPVRTDLSATFARLGVALGANGDVVFDDRAPLAALRRRITSRTG